MPSSIDDDSVLFVLAMTYSSRYNHSMDLADLSAKHIQEAINYETLILCLKRAESHVEPLFERLGALVPLSNPLPLHPNTYSTVTGISTDDLLRTHSHVKTRFFRLEQNDIVLKRGGPFYPEHVASVPESPRFLYTRGDVNLLSKKCVSVIGTRNPSDEGKHYTTETVRALVSHDTVIVSGLALGIDGMAHITTLAEQGSTIGVLGTPLIDVYPKEHRKLQEIIGQRGLLISRFSPATQTQKWHFLLRNRLMSSISVGSVVIEDRDGGGAVKQALYALEQKRKVVIFQHVLDNRSLLWPRRIALKYGVLVVKRPQYIHARLFPSLKKEHKLNSPPSQLSLFDLA